MKRTEYTPGVGWQYVTATGRYGSFETEADALRARDALREPRVDRVDIGDKVRSYDFVARDDCYVEGLVLAIVSKDGCERYEIAVDKVCTGDKAYVLGGEAFRNALREGCKVYPPINGTKRWDGAICSGVVRIE